jgi:hypothetical protein
MSYDYDFFRVGPEVQSAEDLDVDDTQPIGTIDKICAALTAVYPKAQLSEDGGWLDPDIPMGDVQFIDPGPVVTSFTVSRIDVEDVKLICRTLGVIAFDGQEMLLIRS